MNALTLNAPRLAPGWRWPGPSLLLYWLLVLVVYRESFASMVAIWDRSETYTHAYVVPPIVLWLIWRQRAALARLQPRPVPWLALPLAAVVLLWWVADRVVVNAAEHFSLVAMLVAGVPLLLGWRITWQLLFPLAFSFFAVPFGDFLTPLLMQHTADFTVAALRLSGIPVYREGLQFVIPSGHWSVVEACSGIRYLMASFMVGTLFAYLNYRSARKRLLFVLASLVVPIVANWLRAYMIVMLGHLSNNRIATGVDHLIYGWVFFGIVITALFFVGARWADGDPAPVGAASAAFGPGANALSSVMALMLALAVVVAPAVLSARAHPAERAMPALELPNRLSEGWRADDSQVSEWRPKFDGASAQVLRSYRHDHEVVTAHVLYYRKQDHDRRMISSMNVLVGSQDGRWNQVSAGLEQVDLFGVPKAWATATVLGRQGERLSIRRLWWVDGQWTASDVQGKFLGASALMRGRAEDAAALILVSNLADPKAAAAALDGFSRDNFAIIDGLLRAVAAR